MRVAIVGIIFAIGVVVAYQFIKPNEEKNLKVYNPLDIDTSLVDDDIERVGYGHKIQEFQLIDQNNQTFGSKNLKGKVYVAEYFFTTCGTICPVMNTQMQRVQEKFNSKSNFHIVSITVDPEHDSSEVLLKYAEAHNSNPKQWHFLTGKKEKLYSLARRSFFLLKPAEVRNQGDVGSDFIHTNYFVLVDQEGQIRGYYDGTSEHEVDVLMEDVAVLLKEK